MIRTIALAPCAWLFFLLFGCASVTSPSTTAARSRSHREEAERSALDCSGAGTCPASDRCVGGRCFPVPREADVSPISEPPIAFGVPIEGLDEDTAGLVRTAIGAMGAADWTTAVNVMRAATSRAPDHLEVGFLRGWVEERAGAPDWAWIYYRSYLLRGGVEAFRAIAQESIGPVAKLAQPLFASHLRDAIQQQDDALARQWMQMTVDAEPNAPVNDDFRRLACFYLISPARDAAAMSADADLALRIAPTCPQWQIGRATELVSERRFDDGEAVAALATRLRPNDPVLYLVMAVSLTQLGEYARAGRYAQAALDRAGNDELREAATELLDGIERNKAFADKIGQATGVMGGPAGTGSGFSVAKGLFVTNAHVVEGATQVQLISADGRAAPAAVVFVDADRDLALLSSIVDVPPVPLSPSREPLLGEAIFTVGFPAPDEMGLGVKLEKGGVTGVQGARDDPRRFQISISVQPGNSGGGVFDGRGNVIGVVVSRMSPGEFMNVSYAITLTELRGFLDGQKVWQISDPPGANVVRHLYGDVIEDAKQAAVMVVVWR